MRFTPYLLAGLAATGALAADSAGDVLVPAGKPSVALKPLHGGAFKAAVGYRRDTLVVHFEAEGVPDAGSDALNLSLQFPGAGPTSLGHAFVIDRDHVEAAEGPTPHIAAKGLKSTLARTAKGVSGDVTLSPSALPAWNTRGPLRLELCLQYGDASNCDSGSMKLPLRLPDDYRQSFKLKVPDDVSTVERRPAGWAGYGLLQLPRWLEGDDGLSLDAVNALVADHPVDPDTVQVPIPRHISAPDGRELVGVIVGQDPYAVEDKCDATKELRLGLYALKGKTAMRVLEWTAVNCALGRAASIALQPAGELTIGYTNGAITTFTWSGDHFEQTQLGMR